MNHDSPTTTMDDAPVEARIVAWVLGEASAFEAAELERLCDEFPEWLIFRRRIVAIHGLLGEAETAHAEPAWQLPPAKRKVLEDLIGGEPVIRLEPQREIRIRRSGRRAWLAIAACFVLTVALAGLLAPAGMKKARRLAHSVASERRVDFMPSAADMQSLTTDLPKELIEGTPKPINVPNLEPQVAGPAGSSSWGSERTKVAERDRSVQSLNKAVRDQEDKLEDRRNEVANRAAGSRDYTSAKRELAADEKKLDSLKRKQSSEVIASRMAAAADSSHSLGESEGGKDGGGQNASATVARAFCPEPSSAAQSIQPQAPRRELAKAKPIPAAPPAVTTASATPRSVANNKPAEGDAFASTSSLTAGGSAGRRLGGAGASGGAGGFQKSPDKKGQAEAAMPVLGERNSQDMSLREEAGVADGAADSYRGATALAGGKVRLGDLGLLAGDTAALKDADNDAAARVDMDKDAAAKADSTRPADGPTSMEAPAAAASSYAMTIPPAEKTKEMMAQAGFEGAVNDGSSSAGADASPASSGTTAVNQEQAAALRKVITDQEDKVEDRRKVLATIVRTKGIINKGTDSFYGRSGVEEDQGVTAMKDSTREEAIKRGLDAQDYADAKRDFESDQQLLQQMKLKLMELTVAPAAEPAKPSAAELSEELLAAQDPYSTFSLNISDASFQVAQAALARGDRPDPAGIKVEQFYNAVDYGDPAPTSGEPVALAIEQAAHPVFPGRNLVRVALKTAAAGRAASQPLRLTLLVDQSGSMVREDRRAAMDKALAGLASLLTHNDLVTVIGFSRSPRLLADGLPGDQAGKLAGLVNQSASEGGTNLEEAIKLAEQLAERRKLAGAQNRIVLFTDGAANLGDADPAHLAAKVKALRQKGIAFDIAGIAADDLNDGLLGELARNGNGRYYVVGKGADAGFARQLAGAFHPAAENVKLQVRFNPERVGRYKLIGFEKDRLKTEDFRNDAVDAAELAAEEAGVAVYQVEPLPGGSGELGEVSVRFRDAAAGQMVERTWTIPYDASAPALDRATPSMQLAALAMMAAEKLRGGPLAAAIDFKQFAEPRATVKRFYGNAGRVAELLTMLNSL